MNNRWYVYYSCSAFGKNTSAIGVASSPSLKNPQWTDQGMVVNTNNSSDHNAIDPDVMRTSDGKAFLIYGSFWKGIVMTEIDTATGKPINRTDLSYVVGGNPEGAAAIQHGDYYYMFFNRGACCKGVNSTYQIFVGRSTSPTGPFLDKNGNKTSGNGGTLLLSTEGRYIGPGHFGYYAGNGREYMSYHYYDKNQNGASKLRISTLSWQDGWPVVNTAFDACNPGPVSINSQNKVMHVSKRSPLIYKNGVLSLNLENGSDRISLRIYSISGQLINTLLSGKVNRGTKRIDLIQSGITTGTYILKLENGTEKRESFIGVW